MRQAAYYTYRNLNRGETFSTKHKGLVVRVDDVPTVIHDVEFRVSDAGQRRAVRERRRNVHAFVVSPNPPVELNTCIVGADKLLEVKYNPFVFKRFTVHRDGRAFQVFKADTVYLLNGRCFILGD